MINPQDRARRLRARELKAEGCRKHKWRAAWLEREFLRVGGRCYFCKGTTDMSREGPFHATVDHLIPRAAKGRDHHTNWRLACFTCNNLKGDRSEAEFITELREAGVRV